MITYRNAGPWGFGKGSNLTATEVDDNFWDHEQRIVSALADAAGKRIDYTTVVGDQWTIYYTDHSFDGPFTLPTGEWTDKGQWQPSTLYSVLDVVFDSPTVYAVTVEHTSAGTFDPNAVDGGGHTLYRAIFTVPLPVRTTKNVSSADYTFIAADVDKYVRFTNPLGANCYLDPGVFPVDTELELRDATGVPTGGLTVLALSPVTINVPYGYITKTDADGGTVGLKQVATDVWDICGLLEKH